jgi:hypothetical protein
MTYQPMSNEPYVFWNFVTKQKMREFEQEHGEDAKTFQWSYDGNYIAKIERKTVKEVEKTYLRVYEINANEPDP